MNSKVLKIREEIENIEGIVRLSGTSIYVKPGYKDKEKLYKEIKNIIKNYLNKDIMIVKEDEETFNKGGIYIIDDNREILDVVKIVNIKKNMNFYMRLWNEDLFIQFKNKNKNNRIDYAKVYLTGYSDSEYNFVRESLYRKFKYYNDKVSIMFRKLFYKREVSAEYKINLVTRITDLIDKLVEI